MLVQDRVTLTHLGDGTERIPRVGIFGYDAQHPGPVRAQHERRSWLLNRAGPRRRIPQLVKATGKGAAVVAQEPVDDFDCFAVARDTLSARRELDAKRDVLRLVPAGAQSQLQTAIRDVVDRQCFLRQQNRVAEGVAADQHADTNPLGTRRQSGQQRPGFEVRTRGPTGLDQVVAVPGAVEAERLEQLPALHQRRPRQVLVGGDAKPKSVGHVACLDCGLRLAGRGPAAGWSAGSPRAAWTRWDRASAPRICGTAAR